MEIGERFISGVILLSNQYNYPREIGIVGIFGILVKFLDDIHKNKKSSKKLTNIRNETDHNDQSLIISIEKAAR